MQQADRLQKSSEIAPHFNIVVGSQLLQILLYWMPKKGIVPVSQLAVRHLRVAPQANSVQRGPLDVAVVR